MSELARRLINENKKTKSTTLDLGKCGLKFLPNEIRELVWLESLNLGDSWHFRKGSKWQEKHSENSGKANNELSDISLLAELSNLRHLHFNQTQVNNLSPLQHIKSLKVLEFNNCKVADLSPLAKLTLLQYIRFNGNILINDLSPLEKLLSLKLLEFNLTRITDLSPLSELVSLESLSFVDTKVTDLKALNKLTLLQSLITSFNNINDLTPLSQLHELRSLVLVETKVSDLTPLRRLNALQSLVVAHCGVTDLTPLAGLTALQSLSIVETNVTDLTPLSRLNALVSVDISKTLVSNILPLSRLFNLHTLKLTRTKVENIKPLSCLNKLQSLDICDTKISDLTPLSKLTYLKSIKFSSTLVSDLSPLKDLLDLNTIDMANTQIADLTPLFKIISRGCPVKYSTATWLPGIYLINCPLVHPPIEIVNQGNDSIINYLNEISSQGVDKLFEAKLLIVGNSGAGKTSLLRRLFMPKMDLPCEHESTYGIDIHSHEFVTPENRTFRLNTWDFGGQQIYHATHQFFLTKRSLYVLVGDTRNDDITVYNEGFKYWLEAIESLSDNSPVLIFQNEKGGRNASIDKAAIRERFHNVCAFHNGNLKYRDAADNLRKAVEYHAQQLQHIGDDVPAKWIKIRQNIENIAKTKPYISLDKFFDIYNEHIEISNEKALHLSKYFHDLGIFLHFQQFRELRDTIFLQNQWVTDAVFRVLDDELIKSRFGRFTLTDCDRIWHALGYEYKDAELRALMARFELIYQLPDMDEEIWLVTQHLTPSKPNKLLSWARPDDLVLTYRYKFLPRGIVCRLIVRMHRFVKQIDMCWSNGALFEHNSTQVLVEAPPQGNEIKLYSRGPERKDLLSVISSDLDALNNSFHGLSNKVDKWVPCICDTCKNLTEPELFDQKGLIERKNRGKATIECYKPPHYFNVDVLKLLDGLNLEELPISKSKEISSDIVAAQQQYDFFISHASEDHIIAEKLASSLKRKGYKVWLDTHKTTIGDSITLEINKAISSSRFGVVIVSKAFLNKNWPKAELEALQYRAITSGRKVILPIALNISNDEIATHLPLLGSMNIISIDGNLEKVIREIERAASP